MPVAARGEEYLALANLSIGRVSRDPKGEKLADIVHRGETVILTEEQAHGFLTRHRIPVIRKKSEGTEPGPRITARDMFGRPPGPPVDARPDPPVDPERTVLGYPLGASKVEGVPVDADREHATEAPEANDPQVEPDIDPAVAKDKGRR